MCLIAYSPKGSAIDRSVLAYAHAQNPDGIGIMSSCGVEKFMGHKALKRARRYIETWLVPDMVPYAIHFRWATHGDVKMCNTHPYETPQGTHWIMHNGVLGVTSGEATADESDTAVYVRKFMDEAPAFDDKQYWDQVGKHIGWGNKFCVMDANGEFRLCNDDAGEWIGGIWFSNTYSLPVSFVPSRYGSVYSGMGGYYGTRSEYKATPYVSTWGYTNSEGRWIAKDIYDHTMHKMLPNPYYKADEHYPPAVEYADVHYSTRKEDTGDDVRWNSEDRRSYYESLEAGLTPEEADYYEEALDIGTRAAAAIRAESALKEAAAEDDPLERTQPLLPYIIDKPNSAIGGDFSNPDDDEEQNNFRKYLAKVAAGVHV